MSFQISKYDAIRAALLAEESESRKIQNKLIKFIFDETRHEIKENIYLQYYTIDEKEKDLFEKIIKNCVTEVVSEE